MLLGAKTQRGRDGHRRLMLERGIPFLRLLIQKDARLMTAQGRVTEIMQELVNMVNGGS